MSKLSESTQSLLKWVDFYFLNHLFCVRASCLLYFRRLEISYSPEGESLEWRRAGGGVVVGWTWFWSDTPTWSMASLRKEPSHRFRILSSSSHLLMLLLHLQFIHKHHHALWLPIVIRINRATCCFFAGLLWRSWTFWTRCQRLKWAWPIRLMENLYLVSPVGHFPHFSIQLLKHLEMVKMHLRSFRISSMIFSDVKHIGLIVKQQILHILQAGWINYHFFFITLLHY